MLLVLLLLEPHNSQKSFRYNLKINREFKNWIINKLLNISLLEISLKTCFVCVCWQESAAAVENYPKTPILWRYPYISYPPLFKFCSMKPPPPLPPPIQQNHSPLFLLFCFFGGMGDCATSDVLFYLMTLWIYTCWALYLVTQGHCGVVFATRRQFTEAEHMTCFFAIILTWYHTNKRRHTAHTGANRMTYPYKYILTPPILCSEQLSVLHSMNKLLTSKINFTGFYNVLAVHKSLTCRSHISVD